MVAHLLAVQDDAHVVAAGRRQAGSAVPDPDPDPNPDPGPGSAPPPP